MRRVGSGSGYSTQTQKCKYISVCVCVSGIGPWSSAGRKRRDHTGQATKTRRVKKHLARPTAMTARVQDTHAHTQTHTALVPCLLMFVTSG